MFFKKKKGIKLINNGTKTTLIIDGKDISQYVHSYEIKQDGGDFPQLKIEIFASNLDIITNELKEIKIETN